MTQEKQPPTPAPRSAFAPAPGAMRGTLPLRPTPTRASGPSRKDAEAARAERAALAAERIAKKVADLRERARMRDLEREAEREAIRLATSDIRRARIVARLDRELASARTLDEAEAARRQRGAERAAERERLEAEARASLPVLRWIVRLIDETELAVDGRTPREARDNATDAIVADTGAPPREARRSIKRGGVYLAPGQVITHGTRAVVARDEADEADDETLAPTDKDAAE